MSKFNISAIFGVQSASILNFGPQEIVENIILLFFAKDSLDSEHCIMEKTFQSVFFFVNGQSVCQR